MSKKLPTKAPVDNEKLAQALRHPRTPRDLAEDARHFVLGQDDALRELAVVIRQHLLKVRAQCAGMPEVPQWRDPVLLIGPSGVGKTHMVQVLAGLCGLPFHAEDCSMLTGSGYVGRSVPDALQTLIEVAGGNVGLAQCGVFFLDEFDKTRVTPGSRAEGVGVDVQPELLGVVEGRPVQMANTSRRDLDRYQGPFETQNLCLIAAGAFAGLEEVVRARLRPKTGRIGFQSDPVGRSSEESSRGELLAKVTTDDLIAYGMRPELVGRFHTIVCLQELQQEDLEQILTQTPAGTLARLSDMARLEGLQLEFSPDFISQAAALAFETHLGARPLDTLVTRATRQALFEVPGTAGPGTKLCFSAATLEDGSYEVVPVHEALELSSQGEDANLSVDPESLRPPRDVETESGKGKAEAEEEAMKAALLREIAEAEEEDDDAETEDEEEIEDAAHPHGLPEEITLLSSPFDRQEEEDEEEIEVPEKLRADMRAIGFLAEFQGEHWHPNHPRLEEVIEALMDLELHEVARLVLLGAGVAILPRLLGLAGDERPLCRMAAAWILSRLHNRVATEMVLHMRSNDPDRRVGRVAAIELARSGRDPEGNPRNQGGETES